MNITNYTTAFANYSANFTNASPIFNYSTAFPGNSTFRFNSTRSNSTANVSQTWRYNPETNTFSFIANESNSTNGSTKFSFSWNFTFGNSTNSTNSSRNTTIRSKSQPAVGPNAGSTRPAGPANSSQYTDPYGPKKTDKSRHHSSYEGFGHLTRSIFVKLAGIGLVVGLICACRCFYKRYRASQELNTNNTSVDVLPSRQVPQPTQRVLSRYELQQLQNRNRINLGAPQPGQQIAYARVNTQDNTQFTQIDITTPNGGLLKRMQVPQSNPQVVNYRPVNQPQMQANSLPTQTLPPTHPQFYAYQVQQMPQVVAPQFYAPTTQTIRPVQYQVVPIQQVMPQNRPPQNQNYPGY
eukprot:CAMPEP_0176414180 /NCGR_PEP_ID=MMETSP0127-20121128/5116_1 /TAXON_ID=938130 /ORGANISM="Platyophrya macrostoma, Strain WH" /LENGTH=351 /DNA_ID=CAMNT_0017794053 /DNA_START=477 /DNA_END=1532 /DNA_ORIENTATION=+